MLAQEVVLEYATRRKKWKFCVLQFTSKNFSKLKELTNPRRFRTTSINSCVEKETNEKARAKTNSRCSNLGRRGLCKSAHQGPVYTGPDKFLHASTMRLHGTSGTGRIFEWLSVQVWDLKRQVYFFTGTVPYFLRTPINTRTVQLLSLIARLKPGI